MTLRSASTLFVLMTVLSMAMPTAASAQIGVLAGLNLADVNFESDVIGFDISGESRAGFIGGVAFNVPLQEMFSVELDALFSQKGSEFSTFGETGKLRTTYIDIPVLGRYNVPGSAPVRIHVLAGPSFNFKVDESIEPEEDADDQIETFETALVFGGGVTVNRFRVDVRYGWGLTDIVKDEESEGLFTGKNRVFSVLAGFNLR
jgi:hypothetical protein